MFLASSQLRKLNVIWNCVYRRLFGYHKWESAKAFQLICKHDDFEHIVDIL